MTEPTPLDISEKEGGSPASRDSHPLSRRTLLTQNVAEAAIAPSEPNEPAPQPEEILCPHCLRTATNGIKCQGICVADNGY